MLSLGDTSVAMSWLPWPRPPIKWDPPSSLAMSGWNLWKHVKTSGCLPVDPRWENSFTVRSETSRDAIFMEVVVTCSCLPILAVTRVLSMGGVQWRERDSRILSGPPPLSTLLCLPMWSVSHDPNRSCVEQTASQLSEITLSIGQIFTHV